MADPLSITAIIVTLVATVVSTVDNLKLAYKARKSYLDELHIELQDLQRMLESFDEQGRLPDEEIVKRTRRLMFEVHKSIAHFHISSSSKILSNLAKQCFRSKIEVYTKVIQEAKAGLAHSCSVALWYGTELFPLT